MKLLNFFVFCILSLICTNVMAQCPGGTWNLPNLTLPKKPQYVHSLFGSYESLEFVTKVRYKEWQESSLPYCKPPHPPNFSQYTETTITFHYEKGLESYLVLNMPYETTMLIVKNPSWFLNTMKNSKTIEAWFNGLKFTLIYSYYSNEKENEKRESIILKDYFKGS